MAVYTVGLKGIKKVINIVDTWAQKNGMSLNKSKCGILTLSNKGNQLTKQEKEQVSILGIPYVAQYKYLGVIFNRSLNAIPQIDAL